MADSDKEPFLGLSWLQLLAGALAAVTSAWIASAFGVSGTLIGAAVGSFSASIATALYLQSMSRGKDLVRRPMKKTTSGSVIAGIQEPESTVVVSTGVDPEATKEVQDESVTVVPADQVASSTRVRQIIVRTVVALALALGAIGAFEFFSGNPFGQADRPAIGRPWQPAPAPTDTTPTPTPESPTAPSTEPTPEVTPSPTEPLPTEPLPTETPTPVVPSEPTPEAVPPGQ